MRTNQSTRGWALALLAAVVFTGCSGNRDAGNAESSAHSTEPTASATQSPPPDATQQATTDAATEKQDNAASGPEIVGPTHTHEHDKTAPDAAAATQDAPATSEPATTSDAAPSTETSSAAAPATQKPNKVVLGDPSLTAGVPGEGTLTMEQIKAWLDDPSNHEVLEIELPLGLSQGANQIQGLDQNPLTRAKIELGRQLYFDPRLSSDFSISCASCHHPDEGFTRHSRFGVGIQKKEGGRNSPVSYNRILSGPQFWDGRAASLEDQAKGPIENPIEMGNTHEGCETCIAGVEGYRIQIEKIFGGKVNIDSIAKAIASFERTLVSGPSPFDYYEQLRPFLAFSAEDLEAMKSDDPDTYARYEAAKKAGDEHAMSESAIRGRDLYFSEKINCAACHVGANLSDEKYHNLGVGMDKEMPDLGRFDQTGEEKDKGAFKTPTIRNVALSAPYMHDGSQATLEDVVEWYNKGGHPNPQLDEKVKKLDLNDEQKKDLVEFMKACTGDFPKVEAGRLPE